MINKFRVWDKQEKKWLKYFFINESGKLCTFSDNPLVSYTILPIHRYIVQRFVGIRNKDNKELYEGDVVMFQSIRGTITWIDNGFEVLRKLRNSDLCEGEPISKEYEILGNICEQPKLNEVII